MIEHVRRRVSLCTVLDDVIVATCDTEIREVVEAVGGKVIMTADTHERCTERIAEAAMDIDAELVSRAERLLQQCDAAQYGSPDAAGQLGRHARQVLAELIAALKSQKRFR